MDLLKKEKRKKNNEILLCMVTDTVHVNYSIEVGSTLVINLLYLNFI